MSGKHVMETVSSILVINVTRIGDTLLTTPCLRAIAAHYPGAALTFLGHPKRVEVVHQLPYLSAVGSITKNLAPFRGRVGKKRHQLAFVFGFDEALVEYALRVSTRVIAFRQADESLNRRLYRCVDVPPAMTIHAVDYLLCLVAALGIKPAGRHLDFSVSAAEQEWARGELAKLRERRRTPLIGLQIASFPTKAYRDWPVDSFSELTDRLRERWPAAHFLIFGGSEEAARTTQLAAHLGAATTLHAGRLSLRQTAALMNELDLYIGIDTGPTHIMGALHRPMVALYHGYSPSRLLAPLDHPCAYIIDHPLANRGATPDTPMRDISVDEVCQAAFRALAEHPPQLPLEPR